MVTFIRVSRASSTIDAIQQTFGRIPDAIEGTRHVRVPDDWWGVVLTDPRGEYRYVAQTSSFVVVLLPEFVDLPNVDDF